MEIHNLDIDTYYVFLNGANFSGPHSTHTEAQDCINWMKALADNVDRWDAERRSL